MPLRDVVLVCAFKARNAPGGTGRRGRTDGRSCTAWARPRGGRRLGAAGCCRKRPPWWSIFGFATWRRTRICQRRMRRSYTIIHGGTRWNKQSQPSRQAARRGWAVTRGDKRAPGQRTRPLRAPAARRTRLASAARRRASRPCARRPSTPSCASSPCPASRRVRSGGSWREPARRGRGALSPDSFESTEEGEGTAPGNVCPR